MTLKFKYERAIGPGSILIGGTPAIPILITDHEGRVFLAESLSDAAKLTGAHRSTVSKRLRPQSMRTKPPRPRILNTPIPGYTSYEKVPGYSSYENARRRCNSPTHRKYPRYGGRGIQFKFNNFYEFISEVGIKPSPDHTIDRIDNNGHYEVGNIKWSTPTQQNNNQSSNNPYEIYPMIGPSWKKSTNGTACKPCCIIHKITKEITFTESITDAATFTGMTCPCITYARNRNAG